MTVASADPAFEPDPSWAIFRQDELPGEGVQPFNPAVPAGEVDLDAVAQDVVELRAALVDIRAGREPASRPAMAWNVRLGNQQALFRQQLDNHRWLMFYIGDNVALMRHDYGPAAYKMAAARWGCSEGYMRDAALIADTWTADEQRSVKLAGLAWSILKLLVYHLQPDKPAETREKATDILHDALASGLSKREVERRLMEEGIRDEPDMPPLPGAGQPPLTILSGGLDDTDDPLIPASVVAGMVRDLREVFDGLRRDHAVLVEEAISHRMAQAQRNSLFTRQGTEGERFRRDLATGCNALRGETEVARRAWNNVLRQTLGLVEDDAESGAILSETSGSRQEAAG